MSGGRPFHPDLSDLPSPLPVFPLSGALLLPGGRLPLNIFEPRYIAMVLHALETGRMFGMIQPRQTSETPPETDHPSLFPVGCVGRIVSFEETSDGRFHILLTGVCRFLVKEETDMRDGFRRIIPEYDCFQHDLKAPVLDNIPRDRLLAALEAYLKMRSLESVLPTIRTVSDWMLLTSIPAVCPLDPRDQQALLEAPSLADRAELFTALLEMAVLGEKSPGTRMKQ